MVYGRDGGRELLEDDSLKYHPPLLGTPSQGSPPVSSIPSGPPPLPTSRMQAPVQGWHWSNAVVRFLLSQCKEHVEAHNTITMHQHQWERIHRLLVA